MYNNAIITTYKPKTKKHGARIEARGHGGQIHIAVNDDIRLRDNHIQAARALAQWHGWKGPYMGGNLPDSVCCFVAVDDDTPNPTFTV